MPDMNAIKHRLKNFLKNKFANMFTEMHDAMHFGVVSRNNVLVFSRAAVMQKLVMGVEYIFGAAVEGDIAEFGTMSGRTALILAQSLNLFETIYAPEHPRKLHLFDSFAGLPEITSEIDKISPHFTQNVWIKGACGGLTKNELANLLAPHLDAASLRFYEGVFKDTLPSIDRNTVFALVHIDCDLYQSTIDVLEHLFANRMIAEGAVIFFDDYNCNKSSNTLGERKAWLETIERFEIDCSDHGEYGWHAKKFIVHSYRADRPGATES